MMPRAGLATVGTVMFVAHLCGCSQGQKPLQTIEYRGQKIALSRGYDDFDTYKNDPNNIAPSENGRVQRLVREAPIGRSFPNRLAVFQATQRIIFPGYGSGSGIGTGSDGEELLAIDIEIPRTQTNRYLLFGIKEHHYELIDDFVEREIVYPYRVRQSEGYYIFESRGLETFRRAVANKSQ